MITRDPRWSLPRGNTEVPCTWQATPSAAQTAGRPGGMLELRRARSPRWMARESAAVRSGSSCDEIQRDPGLGDRRCVAARDGQHQAARPCYAAPVRSAERPRSRQS
jgi:hypothetical protein